jgi:hypothetical protein
MAHVPPVKPGDQGDIGLDGDNTRRDRMPITHQIGNF